MKKKRKAYCLIVMALAHVHHLVVLPIAMLSSCHHLHLHCSMFPPCEQLLMVVVVGAMVVVGSSYSLGLDML